MKNDKSKIVKDSNRPLPITQSTSKQKQISKYTENINIVMNISAWLHK